MRTEEFVERYPEAWREATRRPFLEAERAFLGVARLERDFWEMTYAGGEG